MVKVKLLVTLFIHHLFLELPSAPPLEFLPVPVSIDRISSQIFAILSLPLRDTMSTVEKF